MSVNTVGLSTTYSTSLASLRKQGDQLTSGVVQGDVGVDAVVNSFAKNMAVSSAYVKNMASGLSYFNVAKTYLEGIRDTLVSMSQQAIQAASSTGTQLAVLNAQFTGLQATLAQVLTNANYDGTQLFTNANSVSVVVADGNTTITGWLTATGNTAATATALVNDPSIRSTAQAGNGAYVPAGNSATLTIFGTASVTANAGNATGLLNNGSTITLSAGSYATLTGGTAGGGNTNVTFDSSAGAITLAGNAAATLQYNNNTQNFPAAATTITGGSFIVGGHAAASLTAANASTSGVGGAIGTINTATGTVTTAGTNIASTNSAIVALAFVSGAIDAMNKVISQVEVVSSSLTTYSDATSQNIVSISDAKEALESANPVDVLGAMSANTNTMNATLTLLVAEQGVQDKVITVAERTLA